MKQYNAIDLTRFVASIFVVFIHTYPLFDFSPTANFFIVGILGRLAVPFFFIVSGYFFAKSLANQTTFTSKHNYVNKYIKRLFKIYIIWTLIYLPLQVLIWFLKDGSLEFWKFYLQKLMFEGSYYTLWYIPALIFACIFTNYLFSIFKPRTVLTITLILYIIGTLLQSYADLFSFTSYFTNYYSVFLTTRNGLFFGSLFVSMGMYLAKHEPKQNLFYNQFLFFLSFVGLTIEAYLMYESPFTKGFGMWFMLPTTVYFLFCFLKDIPLKNSHIYNLCRPLSFLIYVTHGLFMLIINPFNLHSFMYSTLVMVLTIGLSIAILYFGKKHPILKKLY
ncbi:acyltransferase [Lysinibacillus xylanilyticus]|uniref:acyltransferase n=1 Tax=Lysinibacillus xylanilyticus TaxID=582475 RepID=UPI003CFCE9A7